MNFSKARPLLHFHNGKVQLGFFDRIFVRNKDREPSFNRRMFDEDFSRIFHHSNRRSGALFDITTSNQELTERLFASVDTRYGPHGTDETIREWAKEIAESLIWSSKAYYYLWDDPVSDSVRIRSFGPSGVSTLLGVTFQWVPRHSERRWDRDDEEKPREVRFLDGHKIRNRPIGAACLRLGFRGKTRA